MKKNFITLVALLFSVLVVAAQTQTNLLAVKFDQQTLKLLEKSSESHWGETLVSALIGSATAIFAAWLALCWQANKERQNDRKFNLQVVNAICCEVRTLQGVYDEGTGKFLKQHKAGEPFFRWLHISQQHFTIFESNAQHIAKIDSVLAERIIIVYELMKVLVESFGVNGHYIRRFDEVSTMLRSNPSDQQLQGLHKNLFGQLVQQADIIKQLDIQLHGASDEMHRRLEELKQQ